MDKSRSIIVDVSTGLERARAEAVNRLAVELSVAVGIDSSERAAVEAIVGRLTDAFTEGAVAALVETTAKMIDAGLDARLQVIDTPHDW